jgi:hypothetical protein
MPPPREQLRLRQLQNRLGAWAVSSTQSSSKVALKAQLMQPKLEPVVYSSSSSSRQQAMGLQHQVWLGMLPPDHCHQQQQQVAVRAQQAVPPQVLGPAQQQARAMGLTCPLVTTAGCLGGCQCTTRRK